jgi:arylsulfatase A-like enzyme
VLFIAVDDLNDWVGCLNGHPQAKTPNLDRLAARGTVFLNAHVQAPLCNPSRASLLTGLRPSTTGIHGLAPGIRAIPLTRDWVTLPQYFAQHGYATFACGKIVHDGSIARNRTPAEFQAWGDPGPYTNLPPRKFVTTPDPIKLMDWGIYPDRDEDQPDWHIATAAIQRLRQATPGQPFFIAAGFRLPHVPCYATKPWFDQFPENEVQLPPVPDRDRADVPPFAWYLHWKLPEPRLSWLQAQNQWRPLVRAYLASTAFMDSQLGRLLTTLDELKLADHTVVVLWSDNGWHLGEKQITGKNTLWEPSTRVPLVFAGPGVSQGGRCRQPAELLDLYPTLVELCGLPPRTGLEGHSLLPQLRQDQTPRPWPALTTHNPNNHSVRSTDWRYTRYANGAEELYDLRNDPREWTNLVARPQHQGTLSELRRWLPATNAPLAPGSAQRTLTYENGVATWEGRVIPPDATPD